MQCMATDLKILLPSREDRSDLGADVSTWRLPRLFGIMPHTLHTHIPSAVMHLTLRVRPTSMAASAGLQRGTATRMVAVTNMQQGAAMTPGSPVSR